MKKKIIENSGNTNSVQKEKKISRKEALKKTGYMALSATAMMILLNNPSYAQSSEPAPPPASTNKPSGGGIWKKKG